MHGIIFERSAAELGTKPAGMMMMMMMMMMMPGSACDAPQPKRKKVSEPVSGPLGACRGARAVAVLVPTATTPQFKRQIEPVHAPPKRRTTPKGDFNRT